MHELGIAKDLFEIILKTAKDNSLKKITKVKIRIGAASGIESDFLKHSFEEHLFKGTIAEGAKIEIIIEPVILECRECKRNIGIVKDEAPRIENPWFHSGILQALLSFVQNLKATFTHVSPKLTSMDSRPWFSAQQDKTIQECPYCHNTLFDILSGKDVYVDSIESDE